MTFTANILGEACRAAPSADNSQPCHLYQDSKEVYSLKYDEVRVKGDTFPAQAQASILAAGAAVENIVQLSEYCGGSAHATYWPEGEAHPGHYASIGVLNCSEQRADIEEHPIFKRHTNRFGYTDALLPLQVTQALAAISEGGARVQQIAHPQHIASVVQLAKKAGNIRFQTREVHEWLGKSLRFTEDDVARGDGLDIKTLDLPPAGGLFMKFVSNWRRMRLLNKVGMYSAMSSIDASPLASSPLILSFVAAATDLGAMEAGRLFNRAWIYLNDCGLACHPYYVVADQLDRLRHGEVPERLIPLAENIASDSSQLFELGETETLMMLLRVGYPRREVVRAQRVALKRVFTPAPAG